MEDVKDPQNMANNNCVSYLEELIPKLNADIQAALKEGTRPDPKTRGLWMECTKRKHQLEMACGNGTLSPEEYVIIQKSQVEKDEKLV